MVSIVLVQYDGAPCAIQAETPKPEPPLPETLHIYLHSPLREAAEAGEVNIFNRLQVALPGWRLVYHPDKFVERSLAPGRGFGLFHMHEPNGARVLCLRRAYHYPFWRIEATNERWHFDVTRARFEAGAIDPAAARGWLRRWRPKIFGEAPVTQEGFVFLPLQGKLGEHRSFQSMSPLAMIEAVLERDPVRELRATLHPKEAYSPADHQALAALTARFSRFQLIQADAKDLLARCDYVASENSSVALTGYFAAKRAVLFAGSDFHHVAGSVWRDDLATAFASLEAPEPDWPAYLWWFFRQNAINGGDPDCEAQIRARLTRHGWPL